MSSHLKGHYREFRCWFLETYSTTHPSTSQWLYGKLECGRKYVLYSYITLTTYSLYVPLGHFCLTSQPSSHPLLAITSSHKGSQEKEAAAPLGSSFENNKWKESVCHDQSHFISIHKNHTGTASPELSGGFLPYIHASTAVCSSLNTANKLCKNSCASLCGRWCGGKA